MEEDGDGDLAVNHVSKRSRYNKNVVVTFDNADRMEYLSGFRKRKDKRRQAALQQKMHKERQKRIQDRRERRAALKGTADGDTTGGTGEDGQLTEDIEEEDDPILENGAQDVSGTATYEDRETTTTVRITTIGGSDNEDDGVTEGTSGYNASESQKRVHAAKPKKLKPEKIKFKKQKKFQSEKRRRKLTRREKSVPKNMRSKSKKR